MRVISPFLLCLAGLASSGTTVEQIQRDEHGRVMLFCSDHPTAWHSELSADKQRILLTLPGSAAAADLRPRSWNDGLVREVYPKRNSSGLQLYVTLAAPSGYSIAWLPYSRCLLVSPVRWEDLPAGEELYHSALLAAELRSESVAESLLTEAAHRGSADAAALLAVRSLAAGKPLAALGWLRQAWGHSSLPEPYGVAAHLAALSGHTALSHRFAEHFRAFAGRSLPPVPPLPIDSTANLAEAFLHAPLELSSAPRDTSPPPSRASAATAPDTASPSNPPASSGIPGWLLLWSPFFFTALAILVIGSILRTLLRVFRKVPSPSASESSTTFPIHIRQALQLYRTVEDHTQVAPAGESEELPSGASQPAAQAQEGPPPPPPATHTRQPEEGGIGTAAPELAQLWRQRLRQRSEHLRQQLAHLEAETLPATPEARLRLARRLRIPSESLELHYRLRSVAPEHLFVRFRTQDLPSFVSAVGRESHPSVQG